MDSCGHHFGGVFGPKSVWTAHLGLENVKMTPRWAKMPPKRNPKMHKMHPRWPNMPPSWPNKAQHAPKAGFCDPRGTPQEGPRQDAWLPFPWGFDRPEGPPALNLVHRRRVSSKIRAFRRCPAGRGSNGTTFQVVQTACNACMQVVFDTPALALRARGGLFSLRDSRRGDW